MIFDQVFIILFARARRELGDQVLEAAWRRALGQLIRYVVFLVIAVVGLLMLAGYVFLTPHRIDRQSWQLVGVVVLIAAFVVLYRRYRVYFDRPPTLAAKEIPEHARTWKRFRLATVGALLLTVFAAIFVGTSSE
jgi:hypothetical protein